jgi:hypothetical protein
LNDPAGQASKSLRQSDFYAGRMFVATGLLAATSCTKKMVVLTGGTYDKDNPAMETK